MVKRIQCFLLFLCIVSCIEPYEFAIEDNDPTLVVEAYLSDKSFNETLTYPSDGKYSMVKLTSTSDVTNVRSKPIEFALVQLSGDNGEIWDYTESDEPGIYLLNNDDFKAEFGVRYKLTINLPDESIYESDWESLPTTTAPAMGQINFREEDIQKFVIKSNEEVLESVKGIWTGIAVPENTINEPLYYRWSFIPHWIYVAPLASSISAGHTCWATNPLSVQNYALQLDRTGKYSKDLFFMETKRNDRILVKFSSLIVQHSMSEEYYFFWKEMQEQNEGGAIFDKPPFNLRTNFHSLTGDKKVSGYFGIVQEQAKRWYFDVKDLSYYVENTLKADCLASYGGPPAPECSDCREYSRGIATNVKPQWWED